MGYPPKAWQLMPVWESSACHEPFLPPGLRGSLAVLATLFYQIDFHSFRTFHVVRYGRICLFSYTSSYATGTVQWCVPAFKEYHEVETLK
jgi:hypothetical protein